MNRNDRLLDQLEGAIGRLKLEYDIFFNGGSARFPQQLHEQLDADVKRLFNVPMLTYAQRFRLNTLASTLSAYNDLWQRNLRNVEGGHPLTFTPEPEPARPRTVEVSVRSEEDRESLDRLFQEYCRARDRVGKVTPVDPAQFEQLISAKVRATKEQKSCSEVVFVISIEDDEVRLKARPKRP